MSDLSRYARQTRLAVIGDEGQERLRNGHVLVVGCGALGSVAIELLARAGVGTLTIVDRDVVEVSNLQRQSLYDEEDARRGTPKVEAAKARIARINSDVRVRAFYDDFAASNAERYAEGVDVIVDGLDNLETRYLLNDLAVARNIPYVYGAAIGNEGMCAVVRPNVTPCLRCLFPELPPAGEIATCETVGVLGPLTAIVAALEATQAMKLLVGDVDAVEPGLLRIDLWRNLSQRVVTSAARDPECPCCAKRSFDFLGGNRMPAISVLCGRNAVQIAASGSGAVDLDVLTARLAHSGTFERFDGHLRGTLREEAMELTVFADGRIIVRGTRELEVARSIAAKFVGV